MPFTEKEKTLAKQLKENGLAWNPKEGDWFWCIEDLSHQFYLGESLPSSFSFRAGETYVFDVSMTWHIQQGGLNVDRFVWLPTWEQCRQFLKKKGFALQLHDHKNSVQIEAGNGTKKLTTQGQTDLEAIYQAVSQV